MDDGKNAWKEVLVLRELPSHDPVISTQPRHGLGFGAETNFLVVKRILPSNKLSSLRCFWLVFRLCDPSS